MKILITNRALAVPEGSETAVYTLALELKGRGHEVMVFSPRCGDVSIHLHHKGIYSAANIGLFVGKPDVIHVHHKDCLKAVAKKYPDVPKLWNCNGLVGEEVPNGLENLIDGYTAVSDEAADHLADVCDIERDEIAVIHNGINCRRFAPGGKMIGDKPDESIAVLSNRFNGGAFGDIPVIGKMSGGAVWNVEHEILKYDIIAAAGRGAMEAMAAGRAVIAMGPHGIDGMIRTRTWRYYIKRNFSGRTKRIKPTRENLLTELRHYDPELGTWGRMLALEHFNIRNQADKYLEVYQKLIERKNAN